MNIVREHINFERSLDPKKAMGTGMEAMIDDFLKNLSLKHPDARRFFMDMKDIGHKIEYCAGNGKNDFVEYLLSKYSSSILHNKHGEEALPFACQNGHIETAKILINAGANIRYADCLALRYAAEEGYLDIVKLLLSSTKYSIRQSYGLSLAIQWARKAKHENIANYIEKYMETHKVKNIYKDPTPKKIKKKIIIMDPKAQKLLK